MISITLNLTNEHAAGLARFAEKSGYTEALAVLYAHVSKPIREEQASTIISALAQLERALAEAGVQTYPWIEIGTNR